MAMKTLAFSWQTWITDVMMPQIYNNLLQYRNSKIMCVSVALIIVLYFMRSDIYDYYDLKRCLA